MSDSRRPHIYQCPHLEACHFPVDEAHFHAHCREYSATPKHPEYEQCQGYTQMNDLPRNWYRRVYKAGQDIGMAKARHKV